jgi:flagellar protein FlaG
MRGSSRPSPPHFYFSKEYLKTQLGFLNIPICQGRQDDKLRTASRVAPPVPPDKPTAEGPGRSYMTVSSIASTQDFPPGVLVRSERQKAVAEKIANSLPGNHRLTPEMPSIRHIAADIANIGQTFNKKLQFIVDSQSNEVIVKVIDKSTDKVIKVLPPEELQRLHRKLKETIGFLFNEQV